MPNLNGILRVVTDKLHSISTLDGIVYRLQNISTSQ